jgi:hypothetical protein
VGGSVEKEGEGGSDAQFVGGGADCNDSPLSREW